MMLDNLIGVASNAFLTIDAAITALRERLRPECRRVIFRTITRGTPILVRCGNPINLACASGYCNEHCHMFCHCATCGCGAEAHGETIYDADASRSNLPS